MFATRNIRAGDAVLALPLETLSLSEESTDNSTHSKELDKVSDELSTLYGFSDGTPYGDPLIVTQLLLLAQDGDASEWAPYIAMLPRQRRAAWNWDEGLPPRLAEDAACIRSSVEAEFMHLDKAVFAKNRHVFTAAGFTLERYRWAKECVLSRAYSVEGLGGLTCLLPGIDMANHRTDVSYGVCDLAPTVLPPSSAAGTSAPAMCLEGEEVEEEEEEEEEEEVDGEWVGLVADRAYGEGEEVWSSYGPLDKGQELLVFGFVTCDAPDVLDVALALPCDEASPARAALLAANGWSATGRTVVCARSTGGAAAEMGAGDAGARRKEGAGGGVDGARRKEGAGGGVDGGYEGDANESDAHARAEAEADACVGIQPSEQALARARVAVLSPAAAMAALEDGEIASEVEVERRAMMSLRRAIEHAVVQDGRGEVCGGRGGQGVDSMGGGAAWREGAVKEVMQGRKALAECVCAWIDVRLAAI